MSGDWVVRDHERGNERPFGSRSEAEEAKANAVELGADPDDVEIVPPGNETASDGGEVVPTEAEGESMDMVPSDVGIDQDPLDVLPGWMTTTVDYSGRGDSSTTVNKRGCQVIAEYLGLEVVVESVTPAPETDFEHAHYRAEARTPDGRTFTAHGTARADGDDQEESEGWKLDMMAETRAYKRVVKNATGGGLKAFSEERGQP